MLNSDVSSNYSGLPTGGRDSGLPGGEGHDPSGAKRTRKYLTLLYTLQLRKIMSSLVTVPPLTSQQLSPLIKWGRGGGGEQSVYSPQKPPLLCNRVIN